jgi:hypothetical protein
MASISTAKMKLGDKRPEEAKIDNMARIYSQIQLPCCIHFFLINLDMFRFPFVSIGN